MKLEKILVPTDFSAASSKALAQSLTLAAGGAARLHLLHRLASPMPIFPSAPYPGISNWKELGSMLEEYIVQSREEASRELEKLASEAPSGVGVETSLDGRHETLEAISKKAEAWKPDLIAMGTHVAGGLEKLVLGSMTSKVLHHVDANLLLVRSDSRLFDGGQGPRILVPMDFSDHSIRALGLARTLASRYEGDLHLLHVVELMHTPFEPAGLTSRFDREPELKEKYEEALTDLLAGASGDIHVAEGSVASEVLWWREKLGAELVVLGSRGLRGIKQALVGSVAEKVARFSEAPVIVVK